MNNGKRRRIFIGLLALCLFLIAIIGYHMWSSLHSNATVVYGIPYIEPDKQLLCPGDVLRFHVDLSIATVPATTRVAETYCRVGIDGVCSTSMARTYWLPLLDYRQFNATITRTLPDDPFFRPGDYEFWHASTDTDTNTTVGYRVPFTIKADCD